MALEIVMPKMGLTMTAGTVGKWLKREGERVRKGEGLVEVLTEKITNLVESPFDGVLLRIAAPEGTSLPIGGVMGYVGEENEMLPSAAPQHLPGDTTVPSSAENAAAQAVPGAAPVLSANESRAGGAASGFPSDRPANIRISPVARKIAQEHDLDYTRLKGSGPDGRITKEDVEAALKVSAVSPSSAALQPDGHAVVESAPAGLFDETPYSGVRKIIGDRMQSSWTLAPKVTHHAWADAKALLDLRTSLNETLEKEERITVTDMLVKITATALRRKRFMNVSLRGGSVVAFRDINIGVAVALEGGLIVPVIRNADEKSLSRISREMRELAGKARENTLSLEEISGGTFTLTNLGGYRSTEFFTPVINQPESAILGVGRTKEMPVAMDGQVVVRPMAALSLAHDHRIIDGAPAAEFLALLIELIEKPYSVFL